MENNKTNYTDIIRLAGSLLNLSLQEINKQYEDYPICLIDYKEKEVKEKSLEIRFDKEEFTITCLFDKNEKCDWVYLFPNDNKKVENIIAKLNDFCDYDFKKSRWIKSQCYIQTKEIDKSSYESCLVFYV